MLDKAMIKHLKDQRERLIKKWQDEDDADSYKRLLIIDKVFKEERIVCDFGLVKV